jgi:hypothetical protein
MCLWVSPHRLLPVRRFGLVKEVNQRAGTQAQRGSGRLHLRAESTPNQRPNAVMEGDSEIAPCDAMAGNRGETDAGQAIRHVGADKVG